MALRVRFQYPLAGANLGYSVERLGDGKYYDFADGTFKASPATLTAALPEDTGNFVGRYRATLTPTPAGTFTDGAYCVTVHDLDSANFVVGELEAVMIGGDDVPAGAGVGTLDDYARAFLYGDVHEGADGSFEFRDPDDPDVARLLFERRPAPGGRIVTKDPT